VNVNYLGNPLLKKANVQVDFTQEQVSEYIKCSQDPKYFIKNYVKIVHVDKGLVPFHLWDFQEDMIDKFHDNRFVICKMPRQTGKSTTIIGFLLHYVLYNEDTRVAILANKGSTARELLGRLQLAYENLPMWLQQGIVEWNKGNIELENGSKILASATSSSAIRGGTFNIIFLDEFAFVPPGIADEFFRSVYPTISSGTSTKVLIVSTPNGMNMFYKMWINAVEGRSDYVPVDVHWSAVPGRDSEWKEQTIRNTSEDQFRVEFETEFIGSSDTLISPTILRSLAFKEPIHNTEEGLSIWEEPKKDRQYFLSSDVARGGGNDYSAFSVIDVTETPYKLVARYKNNEISYLLYPTVIHKIAKYYNESMVLVENNDIGGQVADTLYNDFEYENMISSAVKGRTGQVISAGFSRNASMGLRTTAQVKRIGCQTLKSLLEENKLLILDFDTISELTTFIVRGKSYAASEGNNDDLVMTLVLFSWCVQQRYFKDLMDQDIRLQLYAEKMKNIEEEITPFGFYDDGQLQTERFTDSDGTVWETDPSDAKTILL
tara:strand:- start:3852 stop:5489 length:1638 start_codon:yes stop_codon:yes gene_type:complete